MEKPTSIDAYISQFKGEQRIRLEQFRKLIQEEAPDAKEKISYAIPTFELKGNLVHFAAYDNHIGFYPGPSGIVNFKEELKNYKCAKGSIQFPLSNELPLDLIRAIVRLRISENLKKTT